MHISTLKKFLDRLWQRLYRRCFQKLPSTSTLDKSGMVYSDHPVAGQGWIKGWVVDTPNRNIAIVARHAGPGTSPPHDLVFVMNKFGAKVERRIVAVEKINFAVGADEAESKDRIYGDIAIIRVNPPFPITVAAYQFATHVEEHPLSVTPTPRGDSVARILPGKLPWLKGKGRSIKFVPGDSGLPWFVWEHGKWKVASHTCKGEWGEGPWYSHPDLFEDLKRAIQKLQN